MEKLHVKKIHIIRGLAALLVVVYHSKFALWCGGKVYLDKVGLHSVADYVLYGIDMLSSCGKQAVIIFFLLSAFVISHSFRQNQSLSLFTKIRLIRIYIPYLASVIFSTVLLFLCIRYLVPSSCSSTREYTSRAFVSYNEFGLTTIAKSLIFLPNREYTGFNFAYWSLLHEFIFYILFPIYFRLPSKALVLLGTLAFGLSFYFHSFILYYQTFFIIGLLCYDLLYIKGKVLRLNKKILMVIPLFLFLLINLVIKLGYEVAGDLLTVVFFVTSVSFLLRTESKIPSAFMKLSDISYSLYLFHLPILLLYFSLLSYTSGNCTFYTRIPYYTGILVALAASIPFYYLFEFQSLRIISKLKKRTRKEEKIA